MDASRGTFMRHGYASAKCTRCRLRVTLGVPAVESTSRGFPSKAWQKRSRYGIIEDDVTRTRDCRIINRKFRNRKTWTNTGIGMHEREAIATFATTNGKHARMINDEHLLTVRSVGALAALRTIAASNKLPPRVVSPL